MSDDSFRSALDEHLKALQARDIERFAATVGEDVTVVDGGGTVMSGRDAVVAAHAGWFASPDAWTFAYDVRLERAFGGAGFALIDVTYRQTPAADPARFVLTLIFARDANGAWKFVYDQNTGLAAAAV